jgi:DNA-binding transcriptional ArsR family regulator
VKKGARSLPRYARRRASGDSRSSTLSAEQFHRISRAISDRTRYDILRKVFESSGLTCGCAAEGLAISAATASHHIRKLCESGLVDKTRTGRYRIVVPRQSVWKAYLDLLERL